MDEKFREDGLTEANGRRASITRSWNDEAVYRCATRQMQADSVVALSRHRSVAKMTARQYQTGPEKRTTPAFVVIPRPDSVLKPCHSANRVGVFAAEKTK